MPLPVHVEVDRAACSAESTSSESVTLRFLLRGGGSTAPIVGVGAFGVGGISYAPSWASSPGSLDSLMVLPWSDVCKSVPGINDGPGTMTSSDGNGEP